MLLFHIYVVTEFVLVMQVSSRVGRYTDILVLVGIIVLTVRYRGNTVATGIKIYIDCPV